MILESIISKWKEIKLKSGIQDNSHFYYQKELSNQSSVLSRVGFPSLLIQHQLKQLSGKNY